MSPPEINQPAPDFVSVAFATSCAPWAKEHGVVLDVDHAAIAAEYRDAGIPSEFYESNPTIVAPGTSESGNGHMTSHDPEVGNAPSIRLYIHDGAIQAKVVRHEGQHMADYLDGEKMVTVRRTKIRKAAYCAGALLGTSLFAAAMAAELCIPAPPNLATTMDTLQLTAGTVALTLGDIILTNGLEHEYLSRRQERRAYKMEGTNTTNVLKTTPELPDGITTPGRPSKAKQITQFLKRNLVPRFSL